jgi:hypothetical protein
MLIDDRFDCLKHCQFVFFPGIHDDSPFVIVNDFCFSSTAQSPGNRTTIVPIRGNGFGKGIEPEKFLFLYIFSFCSGLPFFDRHTGLNQLIFSWFLTPS